ncbi:MAG: RedB protein [Planctomycetes bacterium]|nr:RedB protein [Planctomycetota bacterium]
MALASDHLFRVRALLVVPWLVLLVLGFLWVVRYEHTPGVHGDYSGTWPEGSGIPLAAGRHTLVKFCHPRCSCSAASIRELARAAAKAGDGLAAIVVFVDVFGLGERLHEAALWREAAAIPGVRILADAAGREAKLLAARTSGHAFLVDPRGSILFSGGITAARGHEGDNAGAGAIISFVRTGHSQVGATPVFGCSLFGDG